jgi:hypothetical protein
MQTKDPIEELVEAAGEAADDLEAEIRARATGEVPRRIERDLETVSRLRSALARVQAQQAEAVPEGWRPIESAPKDRVIEVFAPGVHGLNDLVSLCEWHPDAGFCVCEVRSPTHWREHHRPTSARPPPASADLGEEGCSSVAGVQAGPDGPTEDQHSDGGRG